MSVINQMLKDLDQRQEQKPQDVRVKENPLPHLQVPTKRSPLLLILVVVLSLLVVVLTYWVWQYQTSQSPNTVTPIAVQTTAAQTTSAEQTTATSQSLANNDNDLREANQLPQEKAKLTAPTKESVVEQELTAIAEPTTVQLAQVDLAPTTATQTKIVQEKPLVRAKQATDDQIKTVTVKHPEIIVADEPQQSLSISRQQLTAEQLAAQKWQQAEQAVLANQLAKAEQLLEQVLLLDANQLSARKQLAALLFGRQANQQALEVLAAGIAGNPQDHEFRLMAAKIYIAQEQQQAAYQVLTHNWQGADVEYVSLLANVAQTTEHFQQATIYYRALAERQPEQGRWWLGLAVNFDRLGQFAPAKQYYREALNQDGISLSAKQFVRQRLQALGE